MLKHEWGTTCCESFHLFQLMHTLKKYNFIFIGNFNSDGEAGAYFDCD